ncbi:MAG: glucokinase [Pseudomonadota bacterium]|nr:glucokinase [Pseudomonadota bacterium]
MKKGPALIADIGGTNARFAIAQDGTYSDLKIYSTKEYPVFETALQDYINAFNPEIEHALFAVAGPIKNDAVDFTNSPWVINTTAAQEIINCDVALINDFEAQALALTVPDLKCATIIESQQESSRDIKLILGPGTGLGVAYVINGNVIPTEAGHITLASQTQEEFNIHQFLSQKYGHVSAERVCCGQGLADLYEFYSGQIKTPQDINKTAQDNTESLEAKALQQFMRYFGAIAGQLTMATNASSIYLSGGVSTKVKNLYKTSDFEEQFYERGRFKSYMQNRPVYLIEAEEPALTGLAWHTTGH